MTLTIEQLQHDLPLNERAHVLAVHPCGLVALDKPAGVRTHPNTQHEEGPSLLDALYDPELECYHWEPLQGSSISRLYLLNRLDGPTSGVVLCALDPELAQAGRRQFLEGKVAKLYYAVVFGHPRPLQGRWTDFLQRMPQHGHVRVQRGGNVEAVTLYRQMRTDSNKLDLSLLQLRPRTGRTHQLRVQCAARNLPIVGDRTYGDFERNKAIAKASNLKRLFLHSSETEISFAWKGQTVNLTAASPLPESFQTLLEPNRELAALSNKLRIRPSRF